MPIAAIRGTVEVSLLILTVIMLIGPLVAERFRVPGLVGLILSGMVVGPSMLGLVSIGGLVSDFGAVGILYLMFLAGVGFDLKGFSQNRNAAIGFGLLGFAAPFALSIVAAVALLDSPLIAAALIGAMWASNTLVAYPEVQAAGLLGNRAVGTAVSAGVIADVLSLTVLAFASSAAAIELQDEAEAVASNPDRSLPLWLGLLLLAGFTLWLLPKIAEWFFVRVGHTRTQRFVFLLAGMAAGSVVALMGGIEGLVGAFLAGLGLNRMVPSRGPLRDYTEFFGAALFIPAFLVSIGLSIDPAALFDLDTLGLGVLFTGLVVVGKLTAAVIAGRVFSFSAIEVGLMATLSMGQAASTLAIAQVGVELGLFGQRVLNGAVLAIVATALITSYGTRYFAKRVERPATTRAALGERILVEAGPEPSATEGLVEMATALARSDGGLVVPFAVSQRGERAAADRRIAGAVDAAVRLGHDTEGISRIGDSFSEGTLGLADEHDATLLLLGWTGPGVPADFVFGNDIDLIGARATVPVVAGRLVGDWHRMVVMTGRLSTATRREDLGIVLAMVRRLRRTRPIPLVIYTPNDDAPFVESLDGETDLRESTEPLEVLAAGLAAGDLLLVPAHVMNDAGSIARWRLGKSLGSTSIAVVAGPGRLTLAAPKTRQALHGMVGRPL